MAINVDLDGVEESTGGNGGLPNGPYVLKVTKVSFQPKDSWGNEQTWMDLVWDVAEGPHADAMDGRPEFTHTLRVSFKERLGLTKHILSCISRSNEVGGKPFDAISAWKCVCDPQDRYHQQAVRSFEGKLFGGNVTTYHTPNNGPSKDRYPDNTRPLVVDYYDAQEVRDGHDKDGKAIEPLPDRWKQGWSQERADAALGGAPQVAAATAVPADVYSDALPWED